MESKINSTSANSNFKNKTESEKAKIIASIIGVIVAITTETK
jgi:hypothetical protein